MICNNCQNKNDSNLKFCGYCGQEMNIINNSEKQKVKEEILKNNSVGFEALIMIFIVILLFAGCVHFANSGDSPSYDNDDYNMDGKVDNNDVNSYLKDSLDQDVNDGDD